MVGFVSAGKGIGDVIVGPDSLVEPFCLHISLANNMLSLSNMLFSNGAQRFHEGPKKWCAVLQP